MSYYTKYPFISPQPIFAIIKEELRSYFDAGVVDDTFFPIWADKCLEKLGRATFEVNDALLNISDFHSRLPDDFKYVREAWMCTVHEDIYQLPNSTYQQVKTVTTRLDAPDLYCNACRECANPDIIEVIYKTNHQVAFKVRRNFLLTPGNIETACPEDLFCANRDTVVNSIADKSTLQTNSHSDNSYDIRDNKFVTTFRDAKVYVQYYSVHYDGKDNQLIPDNFRIKEYIEAFIKQKLFEAIYNLVTDETYNQSREKYLFYKQMADEAYIMADVEIKKSDVYRKRRELERQKRRLDKYKLR